MIRIVWPAKTVCDQAIHLPWSQYVGTVVSTVIPQAEGSNPNLAWLEFAFSPSACFSFLFMANCPRCIPVSCPMFNGSRRVKIHKQQSTEDGWTFLEWNIKCSVIALLAWNNCEEFLDWSICLSLCRWVTFAVFLMEAGLSQASPVMTHAIGL